MKKKISIKFKLLSGIAFLLLFYSSVQLYSLNAASGFFLDIYKDNMVQKGDSILQGISQIIENKQESLQILAEQPFLKTSRETVFPEQYRHSLQYFVDYYHNRFSTLIFSDAVLLDKNGKALSSLKKLHGSTACNKPFFQKIMENGQGVGALENRSMHGGMVMPVAVRIDNQKGEALGVVAAFLSADFIAREAQYLAKIDSDQDVLISNNKGHLIYASTAFRYGEDISTKNFVVKRKEGAVYETDKGGDERLYYFSRPFRDTPAGQAGIHLYLGVEKKVAVRGFFRLKERLAYLFFFTGIVLFLVAFYISRSFSTALLRLYDGVKEVSHGNFTKKVHVTSQDEIGGLADAFNAMTKKIDSTHKKLTCEIGNRLKIEKELENKNAKLKTSNDELDNFAYIVSHDLREPLRGINNYAHFVMEDYQALLDEPGREKLQTIQKLTHRLESQINDVLLYSRIGRQSLAFKIVNLSEVISQVLDTINFSIMEKNIHIDVKKNFPAVRCDTNKIYDLFFNLISNAVKYADDNKTNRWIKIGFKAHHPEFGAVSPIFYVQDNGIGIREKHIHLIFNFFKRLHGKDKFGGGTGAGLTIAKKIVENHGGRIMAESIFKQGTVFYFTLTTGEASDESKSTHSIN